MCSIQGIATYDCLDNGFSEPEEITSGIEKRAVEYTPA